MSEEDLIITVYCLVDEFYKNIVKGKKLRTRGSPPALSDPEVLTMLIVGEYLGLGSDKKIWSYFKRHWHAWFPKIGCRTSFSRQSANLLNIMEEIQFIIARALCDHKDLFLFDGFPIPTCHIKRVKKSNPFLGDGAVGYCAAKDQAYYGFKGNMIVSPQGVIKSISVTAANIDERDVLPEVTKGIRGNIIADKGLIRRQLHQDLRSVGINLHTPLRKNMKDLRPRSFIQNIMNIRRKIETVIGQLVDRFNIQRIKSKDKWHLMAKVGRKILAHTVCLFINHSINQNDPLQIENLLLP